MIAETLQRSVLPETLPAMQGVQVAVRYLPGTTALDVGGDWFDTITLRDGTLGFIVGDVVGKGVRAAATMAPAPQRHARDHARRDQPGRVGRRS